METRIDVAGLDEFRRDLRRISPALAKTLQAANKIISTRVAEEVRVAVKNLPTPGGTRAVRGITPRATQQAAILAFSGAKRNAPLLASILGASWHPVFGRRRPVASMRRRVWQSHLGASWTPDRLYGVGPVLARARESFIPDEYLDAVVDAMSVAFPGA